MGGAVVLVLIRVARLMQRPFYGFDSNRQLFRANLIAFLGKARPVLEDACDEVFRTRNWGCEGAVGCASMNAKTALILCY